MSRSIQISDYEEFYSQISMFTLEKGGKGIFNLFKFRNNMK